MNCDFFKTRIEYRLAIKQDPYAHTIKRKGSLACESSPQKRNKMQNEVSTWHICLHQDQRHQKSRENHC
jgi:hypothetical protein